MLFRPGDSVGAGLLGLCGGAGGAEAVVDAFFVFDAEPELLHRRRRIDLEKEIQDAVAVAADKVPVDGGVAVVVEAFVFRFDRDQFADVGELFDVAVDRA